MFSNYVIELFGEQIVNYPIFFYTASLLLFVAVFIVFWNLFYIIQRIFRG